MKATVFLILALSACALEERGGTASDILTSEEREQVSCADGECERACLRAPGVGSSCASAIYPELPSVSCSTTFEVDGVRGCCEVAPDEVVRFFACMGDD